MNLVETVHALFEHKNAQPLKGVVKTSVVFPDGQLRDSPGYDKSSGLFFLDDGCFPTPNEKPSYEQASQACKQLRYELREFAFDTQLDEVGALAMLLSALLRPVLDNCPMFLITASLPGSGKTTLASMAVTLATGRKSIDIDTFPRGLRS